MDDYQFKYPENSFMKYLARKESCERKHETFERWSEEVEAGGYLAHRIHYSFTLARLKGSVRDEVEQMHSDWARGDDARCENIFCPSRR